MKIGVSNLKGGVGKTTISQNLAVCFASMGFKTCIVDTDENQNSLAWSGVRSADLPPITVVGITEVKALAKTVDYLHKDYEVVIIDGTPSLSEMTTGIIIASDILIIPILPSAHDFRAMNPFFKRYEQAKIYKSDIAAFFLINQFSTTANVYKRMREAIDGFEIETLKTSIGKRAVYVETAIDGKGVLESSDAKAKEEIINLTKEILAIAETLNLTKAG